MYAISRRAWIALGIALAGHGLVLLMLAQFFTLIRTAPAMASRFVDNRFELPLDYPTLSLSLDDLPPPPSRTEPKPPAISPISPKQKPEILKKELPAPTGDGPANPSTIPASTNSGNPTGVNSSTSAGPFHGRMTKPGSSIVYVLDRSGSMGRDRKLSRATAMLKASLKQLAPEVLFQVVTYDSQAAVTRIGGILQLVPANTANISDVERQLDDLIGEGSSRHFEGMRAGLGLHPDLLVLITDADELTPQDVKNLMKWNSKGTIIHAVLLDVPEQPRISALRDLAGTGHIHFIAAPNRQ